MYRTCLNSYRQENYCSLRVYSQYNTPVICTHIMHKNHVPVFNYSYIYVIVYIQVINIMHLYNNIMIVGLYMYMCVQFIIYNACVCNVYIIICVLAFV